MKKLIAIFSLSVFIFIVSGCAGSPLRISMASPEDLANEVDGNLINAWARNHSKKVRTELERRKLFTDEEWASIDRQIILVGMREIAVYASWGYPYRTNTTFTSEGADKQLAYGRHYIYIGDGHVTSIQEQD